MRVISRLSGVAFRKYWGRDTDLSIVAKPAKSFRRDKRGWRLRKKIRRWR